MDLPGEVPDLPEDNPGEHTSAEGDRQVPGAGRGRRKQTQRAYDARAGVQRHDRADHQNQAVKVPRQVPVWMDRQPRLVAHHRHGNSQDAAPAHPQLFDERASHAR